MTYENIELLRKKHQMTQQEVADVLGCKREVYRRYEKGTREMPANMVIKLAKYYLVTTDYLLGQEQIL